MKHILPLLIILVAIAPAVHGDVYGKSGDSPTSSGKPHSSFYNDDGDFSVSPYLGSSAYVIPIVLPPGTGSLQPSLSLRYNSMSSGAYGGQTGIGWKLTQNFIQRDMESTPDNWTDDSFDLILNGANYHLMYNDTEDRYHTKIESYLNVTLRDDSDNNTLAYYWMVIAPDGTKYRFGYENGSEKQAHNYSRAMAWHLDQVEDIRGNKIYYHYNETPSSNDTRATYPNNITYNLDEKRVVKFGYENRPEHIVTFNLGSEVLNSRRLRNIEIYYNDSLVRKYVLGYSHYPYSDISMLSTIIQYGSDGISSLPAKGFTYQAGIIGLVEDRAIDMASVPVFEKNESGKINNRGVVIADANGDAMLDIIQRYDDNKTVLLNIGNDWVNSSWDLTNIPTFYSSDDYGGMDHGVRLLDVNGDGLADILKSNASGKQLLLNDGAGWENATNWTLENLPEFTQYGSYGSYGNGVRFLDANGDGLVDILQSVDSATETKSLYLNNGSAWNESGWHLSNVPIITKIESEVSRDQGVRIVDANGDGLPDIFKKYHNGSTSNSSLLNNGSGWINYSFDLGEIPPFTKKVSENTYDQGVFFVDWNTDGLVDLLQSYDDDDNITEKAFINTGKKWTEVSLDLSTIPVLMKKGWGLRGYRLADLDGDGITDLLRSFDNGTTYKNVSINNASRGCLLSSISNGMGGTINFTYMPSSLFDNTGNDGISDLPYVRWVVRNITRDNGMSGGHRTFSVTSFNYANGSYDFFEKEFRGFGHVEINNPDGSISRQWFHQDQARKGRAYRTHLSDSSGSPYQETEDQWLYDDSRGNYNVTYLNATTTSTYDGEESGPRSTKVVYTYDYYGNVIEKEILGDIDKSGDEKHQYTTYTLNTESWILRMPCITYLQDSENANISKSLYYYDGLANCESPSKGDLTGVQAWAGGNDYISSNLTYDSYGNVNSTTDALGRVTTFTYDSDAHTFPITATNPLNHTTATTYDPGTGNVINTTDPNNITAKYYYDVFGRITKEVLPGDTPESPTKYYEYYLDGAAPESVKVIQKTSPSFYQHTFTDGFGRAIQARRPAEDSSMEIAQDTFYDAVGRVNETTVPYYSSVPYYYPTSVHYTQSVDTYSMTTEYDTPGRVIKVTNTDGTYRTTSYDHWNVTLTDETGTQIKHVLDAYGRITSVIEYNGTDTFTTSYSYDFQDNLLNITDNEGNVFLFIYDTLGRKTSMRDPDLGTWNYSYNDNGNIVSQNDNKSAVTNFTYDTIDRLNQTVTNGTLTYTYTYDLGKNGTLSRINNPHDTYSYSYDDHLRKVLENHSIEGLAANFTTTWTYDSADRATSTTYPDGETVDFTYNSQGQLESAGAYLTNIDYNAVEKITNKRFGTGIRTNYEYRPDNYRLTRIHTPTLQDFTYTYDGVGNVLSIGNQLRGTTENFGYDELHRLTSAHETEGYNLTYAYNSIGNLIKIRDDVLTYGNGAGPHALTSYNDLTPPQVSFNDDFKYNNSYSNEDSPTITAALNDNFGNSTAALHWYNDTWHHDIPMTPASGTLATVSMSDLVDGTYQYYITVDDSAGNSNTTDTRTINIDTTPPNVTLTTPLDNGTINTTYIHIDGSANEDISDWTYSRGGPERVPFDFHHLLRYRRGDNILSILAQDLAGNLGWNTSYFNVNVTPLESDPPEIRIFTPNAPFSPGENISVYLLIINYNDEEFTDGLRITMKDPTGMSQERTWKRLRLLGKDVYKIRYDYSIPSDAMAGQWLIRAEFTEDAQWHASPTSKWIEVS
jgi:YD repeat-containing protein